MKRIISMILSTMLVLSMTACSAAGSTVDLSIPRSTRNVHFVSPATYTLETLGAAADCIVEAEVSTTQNSEELGVHAYFIATVTVLTSLKGDLQGEILISDTGTMDENGERTCIAEPLMRGGHRVLLFLKATTLKTEDGRAVYEPVDGPVGKFFFDKDGKYHNALSYSDEYLALAEKEIATVPHLDDLTPLTLDDIASAITA